MGINKRDKLLDELSKKQVKIKLTSKNVEDMESANKNLTKLRESKTMLKIK